MGVWIEILNAWLITLMSFVTPFMGVWIEIYTYIITYIHQKVTPFMGVWIEIYVCGYEAWKSYGHSLYGSVD